MSPKSAEDIIHLASSRRTDSPRAQRQATMQEIRETYEGDLVLPLPELDENEVSAIANTLQQGLDGTAQRAASTLPNVHYPSLRPGIKKADDEANMRRRANAGWWEMNGMRLILGRRFRHFLGYATSPVMIRPDRKRGIPSWQVRDPLEAYPASMVPGEMNPDDCAFWYRRSFGWVEARWPGALGFVGADLYGKRPRSDEVVEMIEWVDGENIVLIATGTAEHFSGLDTGWGPPVIWGKQGRTFNWGRELERLPNRADRPTVVMPGRITLGQPVGQFDALPGMQIKRAKLDALEYIAIEEGVFPKLWMVSHPNANGSAQVVTVADGRKGILGEVKNGTIIAPNVQPSYLANQQIDRLERQERQEGQVPLNFGGEAPPNTRTGRATDSILAAGVDYGIQEAQEVMARAMSVENEVAIAVDRGWFGARQKSFWVNWKGAKGKAEYTPAKLFPPGTEHNDVRYSLAGSDQNGLTIRIGQYRGLGLVSQQWAREHLPEIDDPEGENDRFVAEQLRESVMAELLQPGALTLPDKARIAELVLTNKAELIEAVMQVQREAQERQAASGPPGTPEGPVDPMAPEAQPGIAPPGAGQEAGTAAVEAQPDVGRLTSLLGALRLGQRQVPAEQRA